MNFHFTLQDWIAIGLIVLGSFWVAFRSSASKLIVNRLDGKKKKDRGVLTGRNEEDVFTEKKSVIQRFDVLVLYRSESEVSAKLSKEFSEKCECDLRCGLFEADGYDFQVLEFIDIPVLFVLDSSESLREFLMQKESDSQNIRAYKRRFLNNLDYAVLNAGDKAFSQFLDTKLEELGAKRIQSDSEINKFVTDFIQNF